MAQVVVNGNAYSDDGSTSRDMKGGGHTRNLVPMISDAMQEIAVVREFSDAFGSVSGAISAAELAQQKAENLAGQLGDLDTAVSDAQAASGDALTYKTQASNHASTAGAAANDAGGAAVNAINAKADAEAARDLATTAKTQADAAKTQADAAKTQAQAAKTQAETARDAALVNGTLYANEAKGRAAVTDGAYFKVLGAESASIRLYRRDSASVSTLMSELPSVTGVGAAVAVLDEQIKGLIREDHTVDERLLFSSRGFVLAWLNAVGRYVGRGVDLNGDVTEGRLLPSSDGALQLTDANGFAYARFAPGAADFSNLRFKPSEDGDLVFASDDGFVVWRSSYARTQTESMEPRVLALESRVTAPLWSHRLTALTHIFGYGQSLSVGTATVAPISTAQSYGNKMCSGGPRSLTVPAVYANLAPLVEVSEESPASGVCNGVSRRMSESGLDPLNFPLLGTALGVPGRTVEQLSRGGVTGRFERSLIFIQQMNDICKAAGKSYSVGAYTWVQGESDYTSDSNVRNASLYAQAMAMMFDDFNRSVMQITGQTWRPTVFVYQVAGHRRYDDTMNIALAHWRMSRSSEDVSLFSPAYIFPTAADGLHLTAEASWLMGEYASRAIHYTLVARSGKWRPLEPVAVTWTAGYIDVKFHAPSGPLVLDAALCAAAPNQGFDIRAADGSVENIISGVVVTAPDTVRITLSAPASNGAILAYARGRVGDSINVGPATGPRGNLRDSHGDFDKATSPLGNQFALHNACVMFEYSRKTGF